jgi:hypothetical protein
MKSRISLSVSTHELFIQTGIKHFEYCLDIDRCTTPEDFIDWIYQIFNKHWCSPELMHELLTVLDELSDDAQASFGHKRNKPFDWGNAIDAYYKRLYQKSDDPQWDRRRLKLIKAGDFTAASWGIKDLGMGMTNAFAPKALEQMFAPHYYIRPRRQVRK